MDEDEEEEAEENESDRGAKNQYNHEYRGSYENSPESAARVDLSNGEEDENQPLLFVDVNLGVGKQERIVVCDGDQADELAERFARMHSKPHPLTLDLDDEMKGRLE